MSQDDAPAASLAHQPEDPRSDSEAASEARRASHAAVRLLSRRDHCTAELRRKLEAREFDESAIESALAEMALNGYLNDDRFAHLFAEQLMEKGRGPRAISAKLRERGVDKSLVQLAIEALDVDWRDAARNALCKRFSDEDLLNEEARQRSRMARFLESRGFSTSDSIRAIEDVSGAPRANR